MKMEFPPELVRVIREYSMPVCRLDWRRGSYISRTMVTPESNFCTDILMNVQNWRERNLDIDDYAMSLHQLYDTYEIWRDTYHAYFYPDIVEYNDI